MGTVRYIVLLLSFVTSFNIYAQIDISLPDLGEPYERDISFGHIKSAFLAGNHNLAWNLVHEYIYQKARREFIDEKRLAINISKLAEKLEDILNDDTKTQAEKEIEITREIMSTLEPYETKEISSLNISLKHSIEYGATYISWDDKTRSDNSCKRWMVKTVYQEVCDAYSCWYEPYYEYYYATEYLTQIPDYYIYRVINGEDKLITKLTGKKLVSLNPIVISTNEGWGDLIKSSYDYYQNIPEAQTENGRLFWVDLHSDIRNYGEKLEYKVIADNSPYTGESCGYRDRWVSSLVADDDGDGKMDYIPSSEYSKYWGKYYGWMIPVITMLH